jgi:hypothetical protein
LVTDDGPVAEADDRRIYVRATDHVPAVVRRLGIASSEVGDVRHDIARTADGRLRGGNERALRWVLAELGSVTRLRKTRRLRPATRIASGQVTSKSATSPKLLVTIWRRRAQASLSSEALRRVRMGVRGLDADLHHRGQRGGTAMSLALSLRQLSLRKQPVSRHHAIGPSWRASYLPLTPVRHLLTQFGGTRG